MIPNPHEMIKIEPFLAPETWLPDTCRAVLEQAALEESENPRVSPVALVRCSRGGKTRSMMELMKQIRREDPSYGIIYVTFNTSTPLQGESGLQDPVAEICVRIAFAALKSRGAHDVQEFLDFSEGYTVGQEWVKDWLKKEKCILFVDELNLIQSSMDSSFANLLKTTFLFPAGRGLVFSSHVASLSEDLSSFMTSPSNRAVITNPLPVIPSLREARDNFEMPTLSAREALYLGLLPGLIVEKKHHRAPRERRKIAVQNFVDVVLQDATEVSKLLKTLLTGDVSGVHKHLQELMTADVLNDGTAILRWIPFHMIYVLQQVSTQCLGLPPSMRTCLISIAELFGQFGSGKWEGGDAWEALFLIVLLVRCFIRSFDDDIVPLRRLISEDVSCEIRYNSPISGYDNFTSTSPIHFVEGIPLESWAPPGACAISVYYPGHARFEAYDIILAFWNENGSRELYGYQLKEGKATPKPYAYDNVFQLSFLIRGLASTETKSVKLWLAVSDAALDSFFGVSAVHWSAKQYKALQRETDTN